MKSESPEPMVLDDEFRDTQVRSAVLMYSTPVKCTFKVHLYTVNIHITHNRFVPDLRRGGLQGDRLRPGRGQGRQGEGGGRYPNPQVSISTYIYDSVLLCPLKPEGCLFINTYVYNLVS